jgi:hypothetical protein
VGALTPGVAGAPHTQLFFRFGGGRPLHNVQLLLLLSLIVPCSTLSSPTSDTNVTCYATVDAIQIVNPFIYNLALTIICSAVSHLHSLQSYTPIFRRELPATVSCQELSASGSCRELSATVSCRELRLLV